MTEIVRQRHDAVDAHAVDHGARLAELVPTDVLAAAGHWVSAAASLMRQLTA